MAESQVKLRKLGQIPNRPVVLNFFFARESLGKFLKENLCDLEETKISQDIKSMNYKRKIKGKMDFINSWTFALGKTLLR